LTLDLRRNALSSLPEGFLNFFPVLDSLDVSDNLISTIPENFGTSQKLKKLTMKGNKLVTLPENFFKMFGTDNVISFLFFYYYLIFIFCFV